MQNTTFDCILKGIQPKQLFDISKVLEQPELQSDDFDKLIKKYNYTRDAYNMMLEFLKTRSFVFNEENNKIILNNIELSSIALDDENCPKFLLRKIMKKY